MPEKLRKFLQCEVRRFVLDPRSVFSQCQSAIKIVLYKRADIDSCRQEGLLYNQAVDVLHPPVGDSCITALNIGQVLDGSFREQSLVGDVVAAISHGVAQKKNLVVSAGIPLRIRSQTQVIDLKVRSAEPPRFLIGLQAISKRRVFEKENRSPQSRKVF